MEKKAIVYITGAGPGDVDLLTLKAKEVFKKANVIVYDTLVSKEILDFIKYLNPHTEMIYAGKKAYEGDKLKIQSDIHNLLLELSNKHEIIVRLKGGDPGVFGRSGEEAEFLKEHNINFEIIPGVSSILGATAYAGIPLTHRDFTSSFTVLTAHEDPDDGNTSINWESFDAINSTLVLLMGTKNLLKIVKKLILFGREKNTPLAIIYSGTRSNQKTFISTLENIEKDLEKIKVKPPSLIVIGRVADYGRFLNWFENKTLFGKKILITRSQEQGFPFSRKLQQYGAKSILCPIVSYEINEKEIYNKNIINNISIFDWIFFTSQNSVKFFFEILNKNFYDSRALKGIQIACVGFKTKQELLKYNINADFIPKRFSLNDLILELSEIKNLTDKKILIPCQEIKHNLPIDGCTEWQIYRANFIETLNEEIIEEINSGIDVLTFFSSNTLKEFYQLLLKYNLQSKITNSLIATIGNETKKTALEIFNRVDICPEVSTEEGLIKEIENYFIKKEITV